VTQITLSRESLQLQQRLLLAGLGSFWLVIGGLYWAGVVPLLAEAPVPDYAAVALVGVLLVVAWGWARPRVPRRRPVTTVAEFWGDQKTLTAAALVIFLFEGAATLAAVWTMVTGSYLTVVLSGLAAIGLLASGPAHYEEPGF